MRRLFALGSLSLLTLVVACGGGASDSTETGGDVPGARDGSDGSGVPPAAQGDEARKINALIAAAGHLTTDAKADDAPVEKSPSKTLEVPGENGTTFQRKYTDYSLTKVPEKLVALNPNADVLWPGSIVQGTGNDQFEKIRTFLVSGANFDSNNPGVPISYTIRHLTDASQVKLALTTEYTAKDCVPETKGCDGVFGSDKTVDKCGVCGGDGTTCDPCAPATIQATAGGAYVNFNLGSGNDGDEVPFPDGSYYKYASLLCNRIFWGNVRVSCQDGTWRMSGQQSIKGDKNCFSDENASWTNDDNSITTGWQP
jgi:hypothetical protein